MKYIVSPNMPDYYLVIILLKAPLVCTHKYVHMHIRMVTCIRVMKSKLYIYVNIILNKVDPLNYIYLY